MKRDLTVYVASCWYRDNDPHTYVVAASEKLAEDAIDEAISEMHELQETDDESDPQAWSGAWPESLRDLLEPLPDMDRRDIIDGLRASGFAYLPSV